MMLSRQPMTSAMVQVPLRISSSALPVQTSVPWDRPEIWISSEKFLGRASTSMPRTKLVPAEGLPESMKKRLRMNLSVRGDSGEWIIRTLESRMLREATEPFNTVDIQPGDVLIDNNLYGQYAGEVQIARKPMKNYGKTNVVGHIDPREVELLPYMKGSTPFGFNF